jgi:hypothetical protein
MSYSVLWISIIIYSLGYLAYSSVYVSPILSFIVMTLGLIGGGYACIKLSKFNFTSVYFRNTYIIYMLWQLYIVFGGFHNLNTENFKSYITNPYLFLHYFVPLVILIPVNIFFIKRMFDYFSLLAIIFFVVFLVLINDILYTNQALSERTVWTLGTGAGFLLLTINYHDKKKKILAILTVLTCIFISAVMARRNIILTFSTFIFFSIFIILFSSKQSIVKKVLILLLVIIFAATGYYTFLKYQNTIFPKITERYDTNTRDGLYVAVLSEMSNTELIFGKGFDGAYYSPGIEEDIDYRGIVECGYLQVILKGGILNLFLFLIIALPASVLGLFKSNNILSKAAGAIVLSWLIDMFPFGLPTMNIRYILLWICIGICYSNEMRNLSELEIMKSLKAIIR